MHVALVLYGELDTTTGGFRYDRRLVEQFRAMGDTVTVVELPWYDYAPGVWAGLRKAPLDVDRFDVVLQDELAHPTLLPWNRRSRSETPVVSVVHHLKASERWSPWRRRAYAAVERAYLRSVDAAIATSHATARTVREFGHRGPLHVAPPAGDRFDGTDRPDAAAVATRADTGPLQVVALGSVVPRKNVHGLVDAVASVGNCELTVIGSTDADPEYVTRLRRQVESDGVTDRVELTGFLSNDAVARHLREGHLLAVPSRHEGFGIVYLEAMGFGLPVIAAASGGARDVVVDGENGYLVGAEDGRRLRALLERLDADREHLRTLGENALATARRQPDYAATAGGVRGFLRSRVLASQQS